VTCESCGAEMQIGEWPFCPHGFPAVGIAVVDDTVIGGRWCETIGHEPYFYTSKSDLRREAEKRGYVNVVRHEDSWHVKNRRMHMEKLRDTGQLR
jgi:hypothetical protein